MYIEEILNIDNAFETMKAENQLTKSVTTKEIRRRVELCISVEGSHFEHLR